MASAAAMDKRSWSQQQAREVRRGGRRGGHDCGQQASGRPCLWFGASTEASISWRRARGSLLDRGGESGKVLVLVTGLGMHS